MVSINNCPRVDVSITNGGGTITEFFSKNGDSLNISDVSFASIYKGPQKNRGQNQQAGSDLGWGHVAYAYPTGFSIVRDQDGNIVLFNKGDINIDSAIDLTNAFHNVGVFCDSDAITISRIQPDLTIVSAEGDINIKNSITTLGRILCMAKNGDVFVGSDVTIQSSDDRVILMGSTIHNNGIIISSKEVVLCDDQPHFSDGIVNNGVIQGQRIFADHIGGGGSLPSDRVITDDFVINDIVSGPAGGMLMISLLNHMQYTATSGVNVGTFPMSDSPDANGVFFSGGTIKIITTQNIQISANLATSKHCELITPGTVSTQNITASGKNISIFAGSITTSDINVSNQSSGHNKFGGNILLISQTDIYTGDLFAYGGGNGIDGPMGAQGFGVTSNGGNPGGTGSVGNVGGDNGRGGSIQIVACHAVNMGDLNVKGGSNGGSGGQGGTGAGGGNISGPPVDNSTQGGDGGNGGNGGAGGDSGCGGIVSVFAGFTMSVGHVLADGGSNGGVGGAGGLGGSGGLNFDNGEQEGPIQGGTGSNGIGVLGGAGGEHGAGGIIVLVAGESIETMRLSTNGGANGGAGGASQSPPEQEIIGGQGGAGGNGGQGGSITVVSCGSIQSSDVPFLAIGGSVGGDSGQSVWPFPSGDGGADGGGGTVTILVAEHAVLHSIDVRGGSSTGLSGDFGVTTGSPPPPNAGVDGDAGSVTCIAFESIVFNGDIDVQGGSRGNPDGNGVPGSSAGNDADGGDGGKILLHTYAPLSLINYDLSHVDDASDGTIQLFSLVLINRHSDLSQAFPVSIVNDPILFISDTTNKVMTSNLNVIVPHTASDGDVAVIQCTRMSDVIFTQLYLRENNITISDVQAGPVCKNSFFNVFFDLDIIGGKGTAHVRFVFNGSDCGGSDYGVGSNHVFGLQAPAIPGDYLLELHAKDHSALHVFDVKTTLVTVKGISVGIDVSPSDIVCEFQTVTLTAFGAATYLWSTAETTQTIEVFGSNVYSVTGFSDGCSDTAQVAIVVNPLAHLSLVASPSSTIIEGQVATLTVGGANSYVWSTGDTTASVTVSDAGTYAVIGFLNNCSDMANITVTVLPLPPQLPSETNAVLQNLIFLFLILYGLLVLLILFYIEESF